MKRQNECQKKIDYITSFITCGKHTVILFGLPVLSHVHVTQIRQITSAQLAALIIKLFQDERAFHGKFFNINSAVQKKMLRDESDCDGGSIAEQLESILQGIVECN